MLTIFISKIKLSTFSLMFSIKYLEPNISFTVIWPKIVSYCQWHIWMCLDHCKLQKYTTYQNTLWKHNIKERKHIPNSKAMEEYYTKT